MHYRRTFTNQVGWLGLMVGGRPTLSLRSSSDQGKLSEWLCHHESTTNIVGGIIIGTDVFPGKLAPLLSHFMFPPPLKKRVCVIASVRM